MKREHQVIIAKARREGMKPVELAAELMGYTLVEAMREASAANSIPYSKMSEIQQDAAIQTWTEAVKESIDLAIQVIASGGTRTVRMDLTTVTVGKTLKVAGTVDGNEEYKHDLIDLANDQGTAIVILNERDYLQALDGITGEKDQKPLDLEGESKPKPKAERKGSATSAAAIAKKAIEIPPKLLADAREFVTTQQNCKVSAIQNKLAIGLDKAMAVLAKLEEEGVVKFVGDEKTGEYELVRAPKAAAAELTPELYEKIKAKVIADQRVSVGGLAVAFDVETDLIEQAIEELVADGTVSGSDEETGERTVLQLAE